MPFKVGGKTYHSRDEYLKAVGKRSKPTTTTTTVKPKPKPRARPKVTTTTTTKGPSKKRVTTTTTVRPKPKPRVKPKEGVGKRIGKKAKEEAKTHKQQLEESLKW